jgi:hypothetical protein
VSDPADEGQQVSVCPPPGTTVYKKYATYQKAGTNDWFTHTCHPDAIAYLQGCQMVMPPIPPLIPAQYAPMPRDPNPKDYTSGGRVRFFVASGATQPNALIYVNRND